MDELENFVQKNRSAFNMHKLDKLKMWSVIESQLPVQKFRSSPFISRRYIGIAAGIALICSFAFIVFSISQNPSGLANKERKELNDINSYYSKLINYKLDQVKINPHLSESDKAEFINYFISLEKESDELENELSLDIDNQLILAAIIENYRTRLELLENLLLRLNRSKQREHEKSISI